MLIQITNTCRMVCKHCLNDSKQYDSHMTSMTWNKVLNHAKSSGVNVMLISGGEPTEHPYWNEIIDEACDNFTDVVIPTNGMWINTDKEDLMLMILKKHPNCQVQITSVRGYYPLYDKIVTSVRELKQRLKVHPDRDMRRVEFNQILPCIDVQLHMVSLGRAAKDSECLNLASADEATTTSCFMGSLVASQIDYKQVIQTMEGRGHFCKPRINYKGEIGWSESSLCPSFATVYNTPDEIQQKASEWRPCGKCRDYQKLLNNKQPKYLSAKAILGIQE